MTPGRPNGVGRHSSGEVHIDGVGTLGTRDGGTRDGSSMALRGAYSNGFGRVIGTLGDTIILELRKKTFV